MEVVLGLFTRLLMIVPISLGSVSEKKEVSYHLPLEFQQQWCAGTNWSKTS